MMNGVQKLIAGLLSVAVTAGVLAEVPDPNPSPQSDGTWIWYVGNNTQYPVIQDVLDACSDGDEIVVAAGLYVESLSIVNNDVTLRPFCIEATGGGPGTGAWWSDVVFWNPTEGFNNANGYAIRMSGGNNTYVGEPRQITELANGYMLETRVQPGEWDPAPLPPQIPSQITRDTIRDLGHPALTFWSRSIDNVAVYSVDGLGTFQSCRLTCDNGFGGGAILTGESNTTEFVKCEFYDFFSTGQPLALADGTFGPPVAVVTIEDGSPKFLDCEVRDNFGGGPSGIIEDRRSRVHWDDCHFTDNWSFSSRGNYVAVGGTPTFTRCRFEDLSAQKGIVYWDSTGLTGPDFMSFMQCNFIRCETSDGMRGAVAWVDCDDCEGNPPLVVLSDCGFRDNQGMSGPGRRLEPVRYLDSILSHVPHRK